MSKVDYNKLGKKIRLMIVDGFEGGRRGHIPSAMSLVEILNVLYETYLKFDSKNPQWKDRDRLILSKGHGCLASYAVLASKGFFPKEELKKFCHSNGILGGHPEVSKIPGIEASTGSLGHGLSIGVGMAYNAKLDKKNYRTVVIMGDGECGEGSVWEAAMSAAKHKLDNLIGIVDYNKIQSYSTTEEVTGFEPFTDKWKSFGWNIYEADMDCPEKLEDILKNLKNNGKPTAIICHTIKGKGIPYMENDATKHHSTKVSDEELKDLRTAIERN